MAMGIPEFQDLGIAEEVKKEIARATRKANREFKDLQAQEGFISSFLSGDLDLPAKREQMDLMVSRVKTFRGLFSGSILRRTIAARDWQGAPISGLMPYHQQPLLVQPREEEEEALNEEAENVLRDSHRSQSGAALAAQTEGHVSKCFITLIRRMAIGLLSR